MRRSWLLSLCLISTSAYAQRPCAIADSTRDVLRPCTAFFAGRCAVYDTFDGVGANGQIVLGSWSSGTSRVRDLVACFIPAGNPAGAYFRWLVDQTGVQATNYHPRDEAMCGSAQDDRFSVATSNTTCGLSTMYAYPYNGHALEIHGASGNDHVIGGAGEDHFYGDGGDDFIDGFDGDDSIFGGSGNDTLFGHNGQDLVSGGIGNDTIQDYCQPGDLLTGDDGDDFLEGFFPIGSSGACAMDAGAGNDQVRYEGAPQGTTLTCGAGDDQVIWKPGAFGEWNACPADCEHFLWDPPVVEVPYDMMCTP